MNFPSRKRDQHKYFRVIFRQEVRLYFFFKFIYWFPRRFRLTLPSSGRAKPRNRILYFTRLGIDPLPHLASGSYYCLVDPQAAFLLFIKTAFAQMKRDKSPLLVVSWKREYFRLPREGRKRNHPVSLDYTIDDNYNPFNLLTWQSRESFTSVSLSSVIVYSLDSPVYLRCQIDFATVVFVCRTPLRWF